MAITKKNNGKYQVRVYVGYDHITGKRKTKYATCETMREARLKEAQILTDVETGELIPEWDKPKEQKHYTFDEAFYEWFDIYSRQGRSDATVAKTKYYFEHYLLKPELFGGLYLERMTRIDTQRRVNQFIPKYVESKTMISYANMVLKWAYDHEEIACDDNPLEHIQMVQAKKAKKRETKFYDERQVKLFEKGIEEYFKNEPMFHAIYTLLLRTGMRVGELLGLKWENIDFANDVLILNGRMTFATGSKKYEPGLKNGDTQRSIEFDKVVHNKLKVWQHEKRLSSFAIGSPMSDDDFVFNVSRTCVQSTIYKFYDWYNENHKTQLPKLNIHGFRHTHASLLLSSGVDIKKVSERLGHKDITITANIYADVTPKARREVADKFSEIMGDNA
ncbi:integrase [Weissella uvarum]|uniref:site-specific integrase n=1 Tax=Weissella uvarum TaxID=1479233 RepID=UPI001960F9EC|nr:site-specific integrase [Weissella uvarum]MBM7616685.1 integrase [Weissella uvarum]MCM0594860.1 tyrosine-type recombinase/integrase [Weissella uvarum]